ncbi:MAG: sterol desaturase family protein [Myxococcales bacterium]|nr:sterol desaturase family protein [Myxococcales bacterium]
MSAYLYPIALAVISLVAIGLEALFPARKDQPLLLRRSMPSDLAHLVFNGHFLGVILYGIANAYLLPRLEPTFALNVAHDWPLWVQIPVALLVVDFLQWCVHVLLHRVPFLWRIHQVHHSVVDGEMSWIVAFRFHWLEVVVYKSLLYVPLALLGFGPVAMMTHAIFGTAIGHLNHANVPWTYGPLRWVLNNPRMHAWHHDADVDGGRAINFGIIFSLWDWLFRTGRIPADPPARLGFDGVERVPTDFLSHFAWPLLPRAQGPRRAIGMVLGAGVIALGWWAAH